MPLKSTQWYRQPAHVPDVEYRQTLLSYQNDPKAANDPTKTAPSSSATPSTFNLKALIAEAEHGDLLSPALNHHHNEPRSPIPIPRPYNPASPSLHPATAEEYDPTLPLILPLSTRIQASNARRAARASDLKFEYNPYYITHCIAGAPYTQTSCKKCTRTRRCKVHREIFQSMTSVSLCKHVRMNLYWAVDDPVNAKSSWKLIIRDYAVGDEDLEMKLQHRECKVYRAGERTQVLAERLVEDMRRERLRGNVRRAMDEICALLGALERAVGIRREREERGRVVEEARLEKLRKEEELRREEQEQAEKALADTLRVLKEYMEKEKTSAKRSIEEVEEGEVVEEVSKKVKVDQRIEETVTEWTPSSFTSPPDFSHQTEEGEALDVTEDIAIEEAIKDSIEQPKLFTPPVTSSVTSSPGSDSPASLFGEELSYMEEGEVVEDMFEPQTEEPLQELIEQSQPPTPTHASSGPSSESASEVHEVREEDAPSPATIIITLPTSPSASSASSSSSERRDSENSTDSLFGDEPSPPPTSAFPSPSPSPSASPSAKRTKHVRFDPATEIQVLSAGFSTQGSEESEFDPEDRELDYKDVQVSAEEQEVGVDGDENEAGGYGLGDEDEDEDEDGDDGEREEIDGYEEDSEDEEEDADANKDLGGYGEILEDQVDWDDGDIEY